MKTVLVDNSLCAYSLRDDANPEHIYKYIQCLADAGVKYVELDFRAVMKMRELPEEMGYIFRLVDPMFLNLTDIFRFDYMLLTMSDIRNRIKTDIPIMLELPVVENISGNIVPYAASRTDGSVAAVRIRGSFPFMSAKRSESYVRELKNKFFVPIDICPMNEKKAAFDSAVKFFEADVDSLTLTAGLPERYASLDEFYLQMRLMFERTEREFELGPLFPAAVYQKYIFQNDVVGIYRLMDMFDHASKFSVNADTGIRPRFRHFIVNREPVRKEFVSAMEKMAREEDIPEDIFEDIKSAVKSFDIGLYSDGLLSDKRGAFLN